MRRGPSALRARQSVFGERLDTTRGADELHHDEDADQKENALQNEDTGELRNVEVETDQGQNDVRRADQQMAKTGEVLERPAAGKSGAKHLGADQNGGAEHGQHMHPKDAAARRLD